jgi:hypothetical protein
MRRAILALCRRIRCVLRPDLEDWSDGLEDDVQPELRADGGRDHDDAACEGLRRASERAAAEERLADQPRTRVIRSPGGNIVAHDPTNSSAWIRAEPEAIVDGTELRTGWGDPR